MEDAGVSYNACMPIPPYLTFGDLKKAAEKDKRIIPFTGVDFSNNHDASSVLSGDVAAGAKGLKLHPIIQAIRLTDKRALEAVKSFEPHKLPILVHCGITSYYLGEEKKKEKPEYGDIAYMKNLATAFPRVNFIAGHAGIMQVNEVIELLSSCKNVSVDISFQAPSIIKRLLKAFGAERVLYGSDWPWGSQITAIKTVKAACKGDKQLEAKIYHENAKRLLRL
ncbi:MAG: amidohydrolase family protein [Syntrophales bacterium]